MLVDIGDLGDPPVVGLLDVDVEEEAVQTVPNTMDAGAQADYLRPRGFSPEGGDG